MNDGYRFVRRVVSVVGLVMLCLIGWSQPSQAQATGIQPQAEQILRRMSDYLANQQKFTVKTENTLEVVLTSGQKLQFDHPATATVWRPNRLRAHRKGDLANQELYYDGKTLTLYNPEENLYATTAAPPTLEAMLDFAREKLDIITPAADFLSKNGAETMLKETSSGFEVGQRVVAGVKCTHLAFHGPEFDWQVWIEDGANPLPRKFIITSTKIDGLPQYTVWMRNWDLTPELSDRIFRFVPPKGAKKIDFLKLTAGAAESQ